jgi:aconitase A
MRAACASRAGSLPPSCKATGCSHGSIASKRARSPWITAFACTISLYSLPGTPLDWFDARAAVDALRPGAYAALSYTARVHAENIVRKADPAMRDAYLLQLIERRRDLDFPWFPARVVCHDILGQTALVDLAGLRDAIAEQGGDPAKVNPVVPVQLIVDHSLAVECGGFDPHAFEKNRAIEDRRNEDRFHFIDWTKQAFKNVDVIPPGNGIMHQINLEKMSPVIYTQDGVAFPTPAWAPTATRRTSMRWA